MLFVETQKEFEDFLKNEERCAQEGTAMPLLLFSPLLHTGKGGMTMNLFEAVKDAVPTIAAAEHYGIEVMEVLAQYTVTAVFLFAVLLCRRQLGNDGRPPLGLPCLQALIPHPEILRQLLGGSLGGEAEQLAHKVDHIPVLLTAEAVKPLIHLHAGRSVIVERTAGHAVALDLDSRRWIFRRKRRRLCLTGCGSRCTATP